MTLKMDMVILQGLGVRLKNVKIDYAFVSYEKFEAIHTLKYLPYKH